METFDVSAPKTFDVEPPKMDQPKPSVQVEQPQGNWATALKGGAQFATQGLGQAVAGAKALYGPDRWAHNLFDTGEPEGYSERLKAGAENRAERKAYELQKTTQEQNYEGRGYIDDVIGAIGSSVASVPVAVIGGMLGGPQAGATLSSVTESAQEQGFVSAELITNYGMSPAEAHKASQWVFAANLPLNYITDKWMFKALPDKTFVEKLTKASGTKELAKLIAKRFGKNAIQEPVQEVVQDVISTAATEKKLPSPQDLAYTAAVTAPIGAFGGTMSVVPHMREAANQALSQPLEAVPTQQVQEQEIVDSSAANGARGVGPEQALTEDEAAWSQVEQDVIDRTSIQDDIAPPTGREGVAADADFEALSPEEKRNAPIPGAPGTEVFSDFLNDNMTEEDFFNELESGNVESFGAVNPELLEAVRESTEEEAKAAEEFNRDADKADKIPVPNTSDQAIHEKAMLLTLSPELIEQIQGEGTIANLPLNLRSSLRDKRRTISDVVMRMKGTVLEANTQRLGEMMELVRGKLEDNFVDRFNEILDVSGLKRGSKTSELAAQAVDSFSKEVTTESFFSEGVGKELLDQVPAGEQAQFMKTVTELRDAYGELGRYRQIMAENFGGNKFELRDKYFPKEEKSKSILRDPKGRLEQFSRPLKHRRGEDKGGVKVRSPRELQRTDSDGERSWDLYSITERYIADTARRVAYQPVVSSSSAISAGLKDEAFQAGASINALEKEIAQIKKEMEGEDVDAAIEEMEAEIKLLRSRQDGLLNAEESMNAVMQASYNNVSFGFVNRAIQSAKTVTEEQDNPSEGKYHPGARAAVAFDKGAALSKRMFNRAKYKLNVPFIVLRQWTSSGQAWGFEGVGIKDMIGATKDALGSVAVDVPRGTSAIVSGLTKGRINLPGRRLSTAARERNLGTYTGTIKSGTQGRMSHEGETGMRGARLGGRGFLGTLDAATDAPTAYVEEVTGRFAASVAERVADKMTYIENGVEVTGLKGKVRNDFISDVIAQMQSEYHNESRAEILRNPILNAMLPAQSFSLEVAQNVGRAKAADKARLIAGMSITNLVYQVANNYKDYKDEEEMGSFAMDMMLDSMETIVPWSSVVSGRGPSGGKSYTASALEDVTQSVKYVKKAVEAEGSEKILYYERAANELVKNFLPVGGQIGRGLSADAMLRRGLITKEEFPQAATFGWWTTEGGKRYLRKLAGLEGSSKAKTTGWAANPQRKN